MRKITIIGGSGYIGTRLTEEILNKTKHMQIQVIDRRLSHIFDGVTYVVNDIRKMTKGDLASLLIDSSDVLLLNGLLARACQKDNRKVRYDNYIGLVKVARSVARDTRIHFFSSQAVYDGTVNSGDGHKLLENEEARPLSHYSKYKWMFENYLRSGENIYIIYRLATCFGWRRNFSSDTLLNQIYKSSDKKGDIIIIERKSNYILTSLSITHLAQFVFHILTIKKENTLFHLVSDTKRICDYLKILGKYHPIKFTIMAKENNVNRSIFSSNNYYNSSYDIEEECKIFKETTDVRD
ncbi:NAD-dependent epimerase/dehydratase family protein [Martelella alba]|uniref:NAD-dependent epimerase/dehydratase family protein n=1 Tax=Martelella alba TaxID=2590451 RepID=A0ABY2SGX8_9HYPH|nr:NAD-dependent epimerase/dehydratase family protein [Martelella alba]TKI04114.1 NAD-dependent epimerase/dehydratase family protein [Martelella alba]